MSIVPAAAVDDGGVLTPDGHDQAGTQGEFRDAPAWVEAVGRVGLVAYGLVHLGIAVLAVRIAALGPRSSHGDAGHADPRGAVALVAAGGGFFGRWLLAAAALALVAFAVWQLQAAATGFLWAAPEQRWRKRLGASAKALGVLSVAYLATEFATRTQGRRTGFQDSVRDVFGYPGGRWAVAGAGLVAVGMFVAMTYTGVRATFMGDLLAEKLPGRRRTLTLVAGSAGNLTRAVTFGVVGVLTVLAAINDDPDRIGGVDIALRTMATHTVGAAAFVVAALGFAAYFVYCVMDAYARHP